MKQCLTTHYYWAQRKRRLFLNVTLVVALGPALVLAVMCAAKGNALLGLEGGLGWATLFGMLMGSLPLAVHYAEIVRIRAFEKRFDASPDIVRSVTDDTLKIQGGPVLRRAVVTLVSGESYGLQLPAEERARLAAAFPVEGDFDAELERLQKELGLPG
jgi:hypothetical protein